MLPPAPVLFSMMMGWPHFTVSFSAATRASTSLMPPPGNGMMNRTVLAGNCAGACARAGEDGAIEKSAVEKSADETAEKASVTTREIMPISGFPGEAYAPRPPAQSGTPGLRHRGNLRTRDRKPMTAPQRHDERRRNHLVLDAPRYGSLCFSAV